MIKHTYVLYYTFLYGWLKALPLGLAFSRHDFCITLHLWLGIPLFPSLPLCSCLSMINQFGNHPLGCCYGPSRIQRHNTLVSIVHQALLQDHPDVLRKLAFHLTNLDLVTYTILNSVLVILHILISLDLSVISSAFSQAGVAAATGEVAKDTQYQDSVSDDGGDFIPLVCETFGVWTPYAISILNSIGNRTIVHQGIKYQKLTLFCKAQTSMMNLAVNAVFGVDLSTAITYLLYPRLPWKF